MRYLSAVSHATWWGLRQSLPDAPADRSVVGPSLAAVSTRSSSVATQAICILIALRNAATARFTLMGWSDAEWEAACQIAKQHEAALMAAAQADL